MQGKIIIKALIGVIIAHEELLHKPFSNFKGTFRSLINIPE